MGTKEEVFRTWTVQRKVEEQRWDPKNLELVGGVPSRTSPDKGEVVMPASSMPMLSEDKIDRPVVQEPEYVPRRLYIKKTDIETHGMIAGCRKCLATSEEERCTLENAARESPKRSTRRRMDETVCDRQRFVHSSLTKGRRKWEKGRGADAGQVHGPGTPLTILGPTSITNRFRDGETNDLQISKR